MAVSRDQREPSPFSGMLPFVTGIVIGLLTTFAMFSGRISALETTSANHTQTLKDIQSDLRSLATTIRNRPF